jgi:hypothetical protein
MVEAKAENGDLVRRTLVTAGTMVGACVAVVGTLTLVAALVVGHALGSSSSSSAAAASPDPVASPAPPGVGRTLPMGAGAPGFPVRLQKR